MRGQMGRWLHLMLMLSAASLVWSSTFYVSLRTGSDVAGCGRNELSPCKSLDALLKTRQGGMMILVDGSSGSPYPCSSDPNGWVLDAAYNPVRISSYDSEIPAIFDCQWRRRAFTFSNVTATLAALRVLRAIGTNGSAVAASASRLSIQACTFQDNMAVPSMQPQPTNTTLGGAAVFAKDSYLLINESIFVGNVATPAGGAVAVSVNTSSASPWSLEIYGSEFSGNAIGDLPGASVALDNFGAALAILATGSPAADSRLNATVAPFSITIDSTSFGNNMLNASGRSGLGGAIGGRFISPLRSAPIVFHINNCEFINNTVTVPPFEAATSEVAGGAIGLRVEASLVSDVNVTVLSTLFANNSALAGGGASATAARGGAASFFYASGVGTGLIQRVSHTWDAVESDNNSARGSLEGAGFGGAISLYFAAATIASGAAVRASNFSNNTAVGSGQSMALGGAVGIWYDQTTNGTLHNVADSAFSQNAATSDGAGSALGGGIAVWYNGHTFGVAERTVNTRFLNNSATVVGLGTQGSSVGGGLGVFYNSQAVNNSHWLVGDMFFGNAAMRPDTGQGMSAGGGAFIYYNDQQVGDSSTEQGNTFVQNNAIKCPQYLTSGGGCN